MSKRKGASLRDARHIEEVETAENLNQLLAIKGWELVKIYSSRYVVGWFGKGEPRIPPRAEKPFEKILKMFQAQANSEPKT